MPTLTKFFIGFVAFQHLLFLVLELFLWQNEAVMTRFGTTPEFATAGRAEPWRTPAAGPTSVGPFDRRLSDARSSGIGRGLEHILKTSIRGHFSA